MNVKKRKNAAASFPKILREVGHAKEHKGACLEALMTHYGLEARANDPASIAMLAMHLINDFVPAFWPAVKPGAKKKTFAGDPAGDWIAAGGGLMDDVSDLTSFYQAQFVLLVAARVQRARLKTNTAAFSYFASQKGRVELPLKYRTRQTAESLGQAYKEIPADVKKNPRRYLPEIR